MSTATVAERGCGLRCRGAIYAEVPTSPYGVPVEEFLLEPPRLVDKEGLGATPIGVSLVERNGVWHVVDWVGENYYPNVADFVEEVRHMGLSRRLPKTLNFSKLTPESRIVLLHARAHVENWTEYRDATADFSCPKANAFEAMQRSEFPRPYKHPEGMCIATWWHDVRGLSSDGADVPTEREMPSFTYRAEGPPAGVTPRYVLAAFASFPIPRLAVINDAEGGTHEKALERARQSRLPVALEGA